MKTQNFLESLQKSDFYHNSDKKTIIFSLDYHKFKIIKLMTLSSKNDDTYIFMCFMGTDR